MPVEGMNVLAPNYMGTAAANSGVEGIAANYGYGVVEMQQQKANPTHMMDQKQSANPMMNKLRVAKSREFGRQKEEVGF